LREEQKAAVSAPVAPARELFPGYSLAARSYTAVPLRQTSLRRLLAYLSVGMAALVAALLSASLLTGTPPARYSCPPDCGRPPTGTPVAANPRFTAADGSFSVSYPAPSAAYAISTDDNGVIAEYQGGDTGVMRLFGEPARGRSPQQVVEDLVRETQPDATVAYDGRLPSGVRDRLRRLPTELADRLHTNPDRGVGRHQGRFRAHRRRRGALS
jgi:hypothetical protein